MRVVDITVTPFSFLSITDIECVQECGEHGILRIKGCITDENKKDFYNLAMNETRVCVEVKENDKKEDVFFHGILTDLSIQSDENMVMIEVKTGTYLLDQIPHIRSFQEDTMLYQSVIDTCIKEDDGICFMRTKKKETIENFVMQYRETNWEFIKRMADQLGLLLIPDSTYCYRNRFYMGVKEIGQKQYKEIIAESYRHEKCCIDAKVNTLIWQEKGSYKVCSREIYELGEIVLFQESKWFIGKIESHLEGAELVHWYTLLCQKPKETIIRHNDKIRGVSLKASIIKVEKARVQVSIQEDENKENCKVRLFDYATVYSTPDGTGWYCMPEIGDEVRLVFPSSDETTAYVASNVHLDAKRGRENPDHKSWKNKQGKEILFTPDTLVLTNNNGMYIELSDTKGITLHSNQSIFIQSDQTVDVSSKSADVSMQAKQSITVRQGAASIELEDDITIVGGKIYMN